MAIKRCVEESCVSSSFLLCRGLTELSLRTVNKLPPGCQDGRQVLSNHGSEMLKQEDLSSLTVEQLRGRLNDDWKEESLT